MKEYIEENEIIKDYIGLYDKEEIVEDVDDEDEDGNAKVESCSVCEVMFVTSKESSRIELVIDKFKVCDRCYDKVRNEVNRLEDKIYK